MKNLVLKKNPILIFISVLILFILLSNLHNSYANAIVYPVEIVAGNSSSYMILSDGSLWAWGDNTKGQLGDGTQINRKRPVKILNNVKKVYSQTIDNSSITTTYAIRTDNTLWAWGDNIWGMVGTNTKSIQLKPVKILNKVKDVYLYDANIYAIDQDNILWGWGFDFDNKIKNKYKEGSVNYKYHEKPTKLLTNVQKFYKNDQVGNKNVAIKVDGSLWAWGYAQYGELGEKFNNQVDKPQKIMTDVSEVALGTNYTFVKK